MLGDRPLRAVVQRFADAFERGEVGAIRAMLAEQATPAKRTMARRGMQRNAA
jgi:hypothetical protein